MTMEAAVFTETEARIAAFLRRNPGEGYRRSTIAQKAPGVTGRTADRALQRLVQLGLVRRIDEMRPALYRWQPAAGTEQTQTRLSTAITSIEDLV